MTFSMLINPHLTNIIGLLLPLWVSAQAPPDTSRVGEPPSPPIQVELNVGHQKTLFQSIIIKPLDAKHRFDFFNINYFDAHYRTADKSFNEGLVQTYVAYNFIKGVGIGVGGTYNTFGGTSANAVGQFVNAGRRHLVVFFVSAYLQNTPKYEAFTQLQWRPRLTDQLNLFAQLMALTNWIKLETHSRSFQQVRLGVSGQRFQTGLGLDLDQYGPQRLSKANIGVFFRREIYN